MTRANVVTITSEDSEKSAERITRDKKLADAFRAMESDLHDLKHITSIAFEQACEAAQDIYAGHPGNRTNLDRMAFAVGHVEDMINDLSRKWDSSFHK